MTQEQILQEAIKSLRAYGANIMRSAGYKDKTWWVEDNGIWGMAERVPMGIYLDDEEIIELAEEYTNFQTSPIQ